MYRVFSSLNEFEKATGAFCEAVLLCSSLQTPWQMPIRSLIIPGRWSSQMRLLPGRIHRDRENTRACSSAIAIQADASSSTQMSTRTREMNYLRRLLHDHTSPPLLHLRRDSLHAVHRMTDPTPHSQIYLSIQIPTKGSQEEEEYRV